MVKNRSYIISGGLVMKKNLVTIFAMLCLFLTFSDGVEMTCKDCKVVPGKYYLKVMFNEKGHNKDSYINIPWTSIYWYTNDKSLYESLIKEKEKREQIIEKWDNSQDDLPLPKGGE